MAKNKRKQPSCAEQYSTVLKAQLRHLRRRRSITWEEANQLVVNTSNAQPYLAAKKEVDVLRDVGVMLGKIEGFENLPHQHLT